MSKRAFAALVFIVVAAPGCSFIMVDGPPPFPRPAGPEPVTGYCTRSKTVPKLDLVWGGFFGLMGLAALVAGNEQIDGPTYDVRKAGGVYMVYGAVHVTSGIMGNRRVTACQQWLFAPVDTMAAMQASLLSDTKRLLWTPGSIWQPNPIPIRPVPPQS